MPADVSSASRGRAAGCARRLAALLLGVLLLEGGLRVAGQAYLACGGRSAGAPQGAAFTVLCLGDSNTYGMWEDAAETYPARLEQILATQAEGGPFRVVNLGRPGLTSALLAAELGEALDEYDPDLTLVLIGVNDTWRSRGPLLVRPAWYDELRTVKLLRLLAQRGQELAPGLQRDRAGRAFVPSTGESASRQNLLAALPASMAAVHKLASERATPVIFLTYASSRASYGWANDALRDSAERSGLPLIDTCALLTADAERVGATAAFHGDGHPTALGYELFTRRLYNALLERGSVRGAPVVDTLSALESYRAGGSTLRFDAEHIALVLEGEQPECLFAVALSFGPPPAPGAGVRYHGTDVPVNDDVLFHKTRWNAALFGRTDASGAARIPLGLLVGKGGPDGLGSREFVACCVMRSSDDTLALRRVGPAVTFRVP